MVRACQAVSPEDEESQKFVFSLLSQTTEFAQKRPITVVRNSCYIYKQHSSDCPTGLLVHKRFVSHEDFVLSYYSPNAFTEMNVAYPYVDERTGEIKKQANDSKSIFTMDGITFAVEICLDHRRGRPRQVRKEHKDSNVPVDIHLVPSCGMQIQQPAVVVKTGGIVFNYDGQYSKRDAQASPDDIHSTFTASQEGKGHTKMAFVAKEASETKYAVLESPKNVHVVTAPLLVPLNINVAQTEAYGAGKVHEYSKVPLPILEIVV